MGGETPIKIIAVIGATQDSILPNHLIFVVVTVFVTNLHIFDNYVVMCLYQYWSEYHSIVLLSLYTSVFTNIMYLINMSSYLFECLCECRHLFFFNVYEMYINCVR